MTPDRVKWLRCNYYRDGRCFDKEPKAPREEWWMVGKLFRRTVRGWLQVGYDADGIEIGAVVPDGYREWLRTFGGRS